jgi:FMN hydrolase / 5-amino-6-(5-phospho-D-ribitylamino)uracil phosphatase
VITPSAILFDVMGTIVEEPFYDAVPKFFGTTLEELRKVKHPTSWIEFERGEIDEAAYLSGFFIDRRPFDGAGLKKAMFEAYELIAGVEDILKELKARGIPMYAFSNYSPWYQLIEDKLRLSRYLDWRFVSCLTGLRKPEDESFLNAARSLGLDPSALLFIDDRPVNCQAAEALGMPSIVFQDAVSLRRELVAHRVLG